ncbi:MFS transporter [Pseudooceanicola sp.]|uniref:MFS transporter n=1 Tax=Pseudooceanicola sp. TaxID=1914328 RepID=UPI0035C77968
MTMTSTAPRNDTMLIVLGSALLLSLAMGLRQSLGIFMQPITTELRIDVAEFTLAIAIQNLAWGVFQPIAGALVPRVGFRGVMLAGAASYIIGLTGLSLAQDALGVLIFAGFFIGPAMGCAGTAITMSVTSRAVPPAKRSLYLGIISASGSAGALYAAPIGQWLNTSIDWQAGMIAFAALACLMIPAAWVAGRIDRRPVPPPPPSATEAASARLALVGALANPGFVVMALAYFVCGMQLVFLTTHLPAYIAICGLDPMLSATALALIGGFNILGSLFFGWAGGRWNKQALLGLIYITRSFVLAWYFLQDPTPASTMIFASIMGFLWLGVGPLVAGSVVEMFGLRWQAMIQGVAFMSHQFGSFTGALGGGWLYDLNGNYTLAWQLGVGMGLTAGIIQVAYALARPTMPPPTPA